MLRHWICGLLDHELNPSDICSRQEFVAQRMLAESDHMTTVNFERASASDLHTLFRLYDQVFFDFAVTAEIRRIDSALRFRMSDRLTSSGAKTTYLRSRRGGHSPWYEIAVSTTLLAESFRDDSDVHFVAGLPCRSRMAALQRLFEHELIHLLELLAFKKSSCSGRQFAVLSKNLFGHLHPRHQLLRPVDRARHELGLQVGDRVQFEFDRQVLSGVLNRITKRATILVADPRGHRYSDGGRYQKYLVPLDGVKKIAAAVERDAK